MKMRKLWLLILYGLVLLIPTFWSDTPEIPADAVASIPESCKYVALTFDDGPKRGTTDVLLDGLRQRGASATFFLVGEQAQYYPDLILRMEQEGHQIGNHTWSHTRLEGIESEKIQTEVERMEAFLHGILGGSGYWLRPPYGHVTETVGRALSIPMVKWSVDPRDWENRDAETVFYRMLQSVEENSIILLHDIYPTSVEAALRLIDALDAQGYCFVTVEELLRLNGVEPKAGILYRTGTGI